MGGVAPFVGAWIETLDCAHNAIDKASLPSWERGLKHRIEHARRRGLKSLPSWERGLKLLQLRRDVSADQSLPSWERGLKHRARLAYVHCSSVAPFVGAWIETQYCVTSKSLGSGRSLRGSVD